MECPHAGRIIGGLICWNCIAKTTKLPSSIRSKEYALRQRKWPNSVKQHKVPSKTHWRQVNMNSFQLQFNGHNPDPTGHHDTTTTNIDSTHLWVCIWGNIFISFRIRKYVTQACNKPRSCEWGGNCEPRENRKTKARMIREIIMYGSF